MGNLYDSIIGQGFEDKKKRSSVLHEEATSDTRYLRRFCRIPAADNLVSDQYFVLLCVVPVQFPCLYVVEMSNEPHFQMKVEWSSTRQPEPETYERELSSFG